jgi:hypothetical protein
VGERNPVAFSPIDDHAPPDLRGSSADPRTDRASVVRDDPQ